MTEPDFRCHFRRRRNHPNDHLLPRRQARSRTGCAALAPCLSNAQRDSTTGHDCRAFREASERAMAGQA